MDKYTRYADRFTRHRKVERYRRLLTTAPNEEQRDYLRVLVAEEQQKQKIAGDAKYLYWENVAASVGGLICGPRNGAAGFASARDRFNQSWSPAWRRVGACFLSAAAPPPAEEVGRDEAGEATPGFSV